MKNNTTVSGNTAFSSSSSPGGGVYVNNGTFTMEDNATISGNTASSSYSSGGGVYVYVSGTFTLVGGKVYGNDVGMPMRNTCSNTTGGAALNVYDGGIAKYGDDTNILPHTDGKANYTNNTIQVPKL